MGTAVEAELTLAAGGTAIRMPMQWWGIEGTRDVWNETLLARYALTYDLLVEAGITPYFTITHSPPWARDPAYQAA